MMLINFKCIVLVKKGNDYFSKKDQFNVVGSYPGIFSKLEFEFAATLANELTSKFVKWRN